MPDFIYKLPSSTSTTNGVGNSSSGNQYGTGGGSPIETSTSSSGGNSGLNEQQVRDIVNSVKNTMTEPKVREIVNSMQKFLTGQNIMVDGIQKSQNFASGVEGWQIDAEGNAEFNNGTFRGDVILGNIIRTVNTPDEIQDAIDEVSLNGGGSIYLAPGTYNMTSNIDIPSYVYLIGSARNAVIIDFGGTAHSIRSIGTSGNHNIDIQIINVTIQNSSSYGVYLQYLDNSEINGVDINNCLYGIYEDNCIAVGIIGEGAFFDTCGTGMKMTNGNANSVYFTTISNSTTGHGLEMSDCTNMTIFDSQFSDNIGDGINLTNCSNIAFVSLSIFGNGGQGIELVSGCNDLQFSHAVIDSNTSDGIKFTATSDRNTIVAITISNNGGYGINIAAASCDNNQIIAPAFSNNTSGNINDSGTATTILPNTPSFTAGEDLVPGDPVGVSNLISNQVVRASRTLSSVAHGVTTPLFTGISNKNYKAIGGGKFVFVNYTAATSDTLFAQVGSIDPNTLTLTLGTPAIVATNFTPSSTQLSNVAICKLDTDKFIIFYVLDGSTTVIKYRVGTVSGTTITFGTEATATTAPSTVATSASFDADFLSTDKGIFIFKTATVNNGRMICFTTSGTVATFGTPVAIDTNVSDNAASMVKKIATDKFVVTGFHSNLFCQICTVSGTTITAGTQTSISANSPGSTTDYTGLQIVSPATDVFVVLFQNVANTSSYMVSCTVSGTTPTAGSTLSINTPNGNGGLYAVSSSILYTTGGSNIGQINISGNTLTDVGIIARPVTSIITEGTIAMDNGYLVTIELDATNANVWIQGMSYGFIGITQTTTSKGGSVSILVSGTDGNQSGLTAGNSYLVSNGGLSLLAGNSIINSLDDLNVIKSISATQVVI